MSYRNLRPNDNENYWVNIKEAIENSSIFLVVTSENSMLSKDVQKEVNIAKKTNLKRLEYKIDDYPHTSQFKDFFDGLKWIDGKYSNSIKELLNRVNLLKNGQSNIFNKKDKKKVVPILIKTNDN